MLDRRQVQAVHVILPRRGPHRKQCLQEVLHCCLLISCYGNVITVQLPSNGDLENTAYSVVASVSVVAESCLPCRCLAIIASTPSSVSSFRYHVTLLYLTESENVVGNWLLAADTMKLAIF
jgi:hypothetical protein